MNNPASSSLASGSPASPFHPGEQLVQTVAGVREEAEARGQKMLTPQLVDAQRTFFAQLPFVITSHLDGNGHPWAGILTGKLGFIQVTPDGRVRVERGGAESPAALDASPGNQVGLLGIEFARRRRNRINGTVESSVEESFTLSIDQGYGNCPKYITKRSWDTTLFSGRYELESWRHVPGFVHRLIEKTDTFFIASSSGPDTDKTGIQPSAWGADISHRGGEPGFLELEDEVLWFDDYPGNNLFNTLGNLQQYPQCGLMIIDFDTGDLLQIAGTAKLHHDRGKYRVAVHVREIRHWRRIDA
ncbi:MAG: pyridoxamine 5'-phosphate oxidase family protein [Chlorobiales bacterium]|nr:pyridoxamine 5'-phosphate oxidase family protein [Chlorobiales bacterium]